jgi:hypothetical protein
MGDVRFPPAQCTSDLLGPGVLSLPVFARSLQQPMHNSNASERPDKTRSGSPLGVFGQTLGYVSAQVTALDQGERLGKPFLERHQVQLITRCCLSPRAPRACTAESGGSVLHCCPWLPPSSTGTRCAKHSSAMALTSRTICWVSRGEGSAGSIVTLS